MSAPIAVDTKGYPAPLERSALSDEEKSQDSHSGQASTSSTLEADVLVRHYEPPDSYENKHRYDPTAKWTPAEERALLRRLDLRVAFVACVCFAALQLDRGNISQALSDNLLKDIGLTTGDYNLGMTLFYLCFLCAELPSQMISKKLGSDVWIPIQIITWSAIAIAQVGLHDRKSFLATRCLLGLVEGGFIADTILYLSYYYTHAELAVRLSFFWVTYMGTNIIGSLLAAGILQLRGRNGWPGWKWLFLIEGVVTFCIGLFALVYLPPGPTETHKTWLSKLHNRHVGNNKVVDGKQTDSDGDSDRNAEEEAPRGWFTVREEVIIVNKVLRDDPTKSSMHNREGLSLGEFWLSLKDFDMWPLYIVGLVHFIPQGTVGAYLTLTLKQLGYTTFQTNLLTIPASVIFILGNLGTSFAAKYSKQRLLSASFAAWWGVIVMIALVAVPDTISKWGKWAILTLLVGQPYVHPILVGLNSSNSGSVRTRTVASSLYNMFVQASTLVASNVYQPSDAPYYHKGNRALLAVAIVDVALFIFAKLYYVFRNRSKAAKWDSMSIEEKDHYLATTTDKGNKRLDFRFLS